jgi:hypothetical protein
VTSVYEVTFRCGHRWLATHQITPATLRQFYGIAVPKEYARRQAKLQDIARGDVEGYLIHVAPGGIDYVLEIEVTI